MEGHYYHPRHTQATLVCCGPVEIGLEGCYGPNNMALKYPGALWSSWNGNGAEAPRNVGAKPLQGSMI
jgi:hypothetical protein